MLCLWDRGRDVPAVPVAGGFAVTLGALGEDGVEEGEHRDGGEGGEMHLVDNGGGGSGGKRLGDEQNRRRRTGEREKRGIETLVYNLPPSTRPGSPRSGGREAVSAIYNTGPRCFPR